MAELAGGLVDRVHDAQLQFRDLLGAMSRPGRVVMLRGHLPEPPRPFAAATYALLLGLADHETALWTDDECLEAIGSIRFHTGARHVDDPKRADFAVVTRGTTLPPLEQFALGESDYPDRSTTLLIQVESLRLGQRMRLQGPGIDGTEVLTVDGLPDDFSTVMAANRRRFPLGVDLVLVAGPAIVGLPRTTIVEE